MESHKMIDGHAAAYLTDVVQHLTELNAKVDDLRWRLCYSDQPHVYTHSTRKAGRDLLHALVMLDHVLEHPESDERSTKIGIVK